MITFEKLESTIAKWMLLADKQVVKLLCATVIANRIPKFKPTWLFLVSNSSGGKSELLSALCNAKNMWEQDNMSAKTLISGAKNATTETSLIHRMPAGSIMVLKDLTLLLDKDPKETAQIFSQLRLIYDGKLFSSYGTGEDIRAVVKMGLIAGTTPAIEDTSARQATMGMRTIKYYMKQPDRLEVTRMSLSDDDDSKEDETLMQVEMGAAFKEYLDGVVIPDNIPKLPLGVKEDVVRLSEMSTAARSSIKRRDYSHTREIERLDLKEMPIRMAKQLRNLGRALMIMNGANLPEGEVSGLTGLDARILYQIALDSIPSVRKEIMEAATYSESVTLEGLTSAIRIDQESVKMHLNDLVALEIMSSAKGFGNKFTYRLRDDYRQLMAKFEGIEMTNKTLDDGDNPYSNIDRDMPEDPGIPIEQIPIEELPL